MVPPSFRSYSEYDPDEQTRIEEALAAARARKFSKRERKCRVLVSFWGFGERGKCSTLVGSLMHAFRTRSIYCSEVDEQRFEGLISLYKAQMPALQEICSYVKMSMDTLEMGECRQGVCIRCNAECLHQGFLACLKRIENGETRRGEHPATWGKGFHELIMDMQMKENVLKVTSLPFDANNMIMLYFSHRAAEQHARQMKERLELLKRENRRMQFEAHRASVLETENCRIMFAMQNAYRAGTIKSEVFQEIICGGSRRIQPEAGRPSWGI